jgi:capsular exopolysaccharide synthesis family protein
MLTQPNRLQALTDQGGVGAETFRALAIRLKHFQERQHIRRLLVTSSIKGEGKSVISANLAVSLARRQKTLLIDGDLHQSGLQDVIGIRGQAGLADWWRGEKPIAGFLRRMEGLSLWYLAAGQAAEQPLEILQSQKLSTMLDEVAQWFDWIVIDSSPVIPVADCSLWARLSDRALMVVRRGKTPKPLLQKALKTDNLKVLGIVTNDWEDADHKYYRQYYKNTRSSNLAPMIERHPSEPKNFCLPGPVRGQTE